MPKNKPSSEASSKIIILKLGKKTDNLLTILVSEGYLSVIPNKHQLTSKEKQVSGTHKKGRFGDYFLWSNHFDL